MTVRVVSLLPSATEIVTKVILAQGPGPTVQLVGKRWVWVQAAEWDREVFEIHAWNETLHCVEPGKPDHGLGEYALASSPPCSHECDYGPTSLAGLPILTAARTNFTTSADVDEQVRTSLAAGESLYSVDRDLLRSLKPDVVLTQVRGGERGFCMRFVLILYDLKADTLFSICARASVKHPWPLDVSIRHQCPTTDPIPLRSTTQPRRASARCAASTSARCKPPWRRCSPRPSWWTCRPRTSGRCWTT